MTSEILRTDEVDWSKIHPLRGTKQKIRKPKADPAWKLISKRLEKRPSKYPYSPSRRDEAIEALAEFAEQPEPPLDLSSQVRLAKVLQDISGPRPEKGLVAFWYASEGAIFTMRALMELGAPENGWRELRRYLSVCPVDEYTSALEEAARAYKQARWDLRVYLSFTFPERTDWVAEVAEVWRENHFHSGRGWMLLAALPDPMMLTDVKFRFKDDDWFADARAYVADLSLQHGGAALPMFEKLIRRLRSAAHKRTCAKPLLFWESEQIARFFARHLKGGPLKEMAASYLRIHPALAMTALKAVGSAPARALLDELQERQEDGPVSSYIELPSILQDPPWLAKSTGMSGPLADFPAKLPRLSGFVELAALPRPRLKSGAALPDEAMKHLATMLQFSSLESPYAGLEQVRRECDPESLADFCWGLAQQWLAANGTSASGWAFFSVAHFHSPTSVREVASVVNRWQRERSSRVALGLDLLQRVGTDRALMQLARLAEKGLARKTRLAAEQKLAEVAKNRGLSHLEMADRVVPDLGLDAAGTLRLDFGSRVLTVDFNEALKPRLWDSEKKPVARFPRAKKSDDKALFRKASARWKLLCNDAASVAEGQIRRLENAMVHRRFWSATDFREFLVEHPLMNHLARKLVWGSCLSEEPIKTFRVCEDRTLANVVDDEYRLPDGAAICIVHPIEVELADWGKVFADYEIIQPFAQLKREVFKLSPGQSQVSVWSKVVGRRIPVRVLLGLRRMDWELVHDEYAFTSYHKCFGEKAAHIYFQPGLDAYDMAASGEQTIECVEVTPSAPLDPLQFSELMRDLETL